MGVEFGYLGLLFHLEYLNVLMYANWAGLIVNTNFHLGEVALSMRRRVRLDLARPQSCIIARIGPKTMNCVEPAGRALEQQKPAKHKGNAQRAAHSLR